MTLRACTLCERWIGLVLLSATLMLATAPAAHADELEMRVKAAFLYNFARFTSWPDDQLDPGSFVLCVRAGEALNAALLSAIADKELQGRRVSVRRLGPGEAIQGCQLLYLDIGSDGGPGLAAATAMLTVGEGREFAQNQGMIGFYLIDGRLRFAINPERARQAGLQLSSRLLGLAEIVDSGEPDG